jgi:predicted  nucleic acid-binding Zn-ribbon protein
LSLLQIQQARELDPEIQSQVAAKIQAKQADLTAIQARVEAAQKALDDLQKEFDASGAPAEWSQAEKPSTENPPPSP